MKKNSLHNRIFIGLFLLLCLLPVLGMLVFGPAKPAANEILASKPKLISRDGEWNRDFLSDLSDYVGDRFYARQQCITAWSVLNAKLFGTSADESVVLGKNGSLYYAESLNDYMGISLSDAEIRTAAENLLAIQQYVEAKGASFVFAVAPNKNSLYPTDMPGYIPADHENGNAVRLMQAMDELGVHYADLSAALSAEEKQLYYRTDSHWTTEGAALGADTLLTALGRPTNYYSGSFTAGDEHRGDLYEMLYPAGTFTETDSVPVSGFSFETASNPNGGEAPTIKASCAAGQRTLLCWRDSFGNALYPWLAESFAEATFLRANPYDLSKLEETGADTVIIELVERNIGWLVSRPPVIPEN